MVRISDSIEVRTVETPKTSAKSIVVMALGAFTLFISVLFILSIILIIPGIFGVLIGLLIMYAGVQRTSIECVACNQPIKVKVTDKNGECEHCKTVNPIVWSK